MPPKGRKGKKPAATPIGQSSSSSAEEETIAIGTVYEGYRSDLTAALQDLLDDLVAYRSEHNAGYPDIHARTAETLEKCPGPSEDSLIGKENRLITVDSILQSLVFKFPLKNNADHGILEDLLDVALSCSEIGAVLDTTTPTLLQALIERDTIEGAEILFSYMESRKDRLTVDFDPRKMKALTILRTCNELLKRLSTSNHTVFCGRILMFLSSAFPIADLSSVNLRGAYNTGNNTTLQDPEWGSKPESDSRGDTTDADQEEGETQESTKSEAFPAPILESTSQPDAYTLFWSLQTIFSYPLNLTKPEPIFLQMHIPSSIPIVKAPPTDWQIPRDAKANNAPMVDMPNLRYLRFAGNAMLDVFSTANKKEKEVAGSGKQSATVKAAENFSVDAVRQHYFFPKFLTSRNLFDLEVADVNFRRQIIVQLLVILLFMRGYTPAERSKVKQLEKGEETKAKKSVNSNRANLLPGFTISAEDITWLRELNVRALTELRATSPDGERFASTVNLILNRENHWIQWKLLSCADFARPPLEQPEASEDGKTRKRKLLAKQNKLPWPVGNPSLSRIWAAGGADAHNVDDLKDQHLPKDMAYFKEHLEEELLIQQQRKESLTGDTVPGQGILQGDSEWAAAEDRKNSLIWRMLRLMPSEDAAYYTLMKGCPNIIELFERIRLAKEKAVSAASVAKTIKIDDVEMPDVKKADALPTQVSATKRERSAEEDATMDEASRTIKRTKTEEPKAEVA